MKFKIGDKVHSILCSVVFGKVTQIIGDTNFMLDIGCRELICHQDYYVKLGNNNDSK